MICVFEFICLSTAKVVFNTRSFLGPVYALILCSLAGVNLCSASPLGSNPDPQSLSPGAQRLLKSVSPDSVCWHTQNACAFACTHAHARVRQSVPGSHSLTHILDPVFCVDRGAAQQLQAQRHNDTTDLSFYEQVHVSASVQRELSSPYKSATSPVLPVFDV